MSASFLDSNIPLYLLSSDERKRNIAKILFADDVIVSVQVLNEIVSVAWRKHDLAWEQIGQFVESLLELATVTPLTVELHNSARDMAARYGFAFYDLLIVAAAIGANCTTLFSEDMRHRQRIGGLTIINPFLSVDVPP